MSPARSDAAPLGQGTTSTGWDALSLGAVLVTILCWASAFSGVKIGLQDFSPGAFALYRFLAASAALGLYAALFRLKPPPRALWGRVALLSVIGITAYHLLLNWGQRTVPAGTASLIIATVPVFTALLAARLGQERLTPLGWVGTAVSLAGVLLIVLGRGQGLGFTAGAGLIVGAGVCSALYFALQRPLLRQIRPLNFTAYSILLGTVPMLVFAPQLAREFAGAAPAAHLAALYTGVFPAALAYVTWSYAISRVGAGLTSNFLFVSPVLALVIAYFAVSEVPTARTVLGGAVAIAGVVLVNTLGRARA